VPVLSYENGFFCTDEYCLLYFAEHGLTPGPVSEMRFIDDQPAGPMSGQKRCIRSNF
jgi:hypothetical protein